MNCLTFHRCMSAAAAAVLGTVVGCGSPVRLDATCGKMCLTSAGPVIPAVPETWRPDARLPDAPAVRLDDGSKIPEGGDTGVEDRDAGSGPVVVADAGIRDALSAVPSYPAVEIAWTAELLFNEVLDQLPSVSDGLTAEVKVTVVELSSSVDLAFVERIEVSMSHGKAKSDGGIASTVDAGVACAAPGSVMPLAAFQATEIPVGRSVIPLQLLEPGLNVFDCVKSEKTKLHIRLIPRAGATPEEDAPLTLKTCIQTALHTRLP